MILRATKFDFEENYAFQNAKFRLVGCRFESNCSLVGPGTTGGVPSVGGLSKGSYAVFARVSEKTTENSE